ncbi:MAG: hypothetical protein V1487_00130 [bacterium]
MSAFALTEVHQEHIKEFAQEKGFPENALSLLYETVSTEWGHKLGNVVMKEYASLIDFSSPDYQDWVEKQNNRLKQLRIELASTDLGKETIAKIPRDVDDGFSTIPLPSVPAELIEEQKKRFNIK